MASGFVGATKAVDQRLEAGDDFFKLAAAAIEAVNAGVDQKTGCEKPVEQRYWHVSIVVTPKRPVSIL